MSFVLFLKKVPLFSHGLLFYIQAFIRELIRFHGHK